MSDVQMNYAEALAIVQDLAVGNQIDENDVAFGDDALEAQRKLQDASLETVQAYIDRGGHDALPPVPEEGEALLAAPEQDGEPDPANLRDALLVALDMARNNILDDDSEDMADEVARQERAVALVEDVLSRHPDALAVPQGPSVA